MPLRGAVCRSGGPLPHADFNPSAAFFCSLHALLRRDCSAESPVDVRARRLGLMSMSAQRERTSRDDFPPCGIGGPATDGTASKTAGYARSLLRVFAGGALIDPIDPVVAEKL